MKRLLVLLYGVACYAVFAQVLLYFIGFLEGFLVEKTVNSGAPPPLARAVLIDSALIGLFGVQHSVMARRRFKAWWSLLVPACIERSTYVLATSLAFVALIHGWQPIPGTIWQIDQPLAKTAMYAISAGGWLLVLLATFMTNHFDLFGLRQVYLYSVRRRYMPVPFEEKWLYRWIRHPMMSGVLIAVWATPAMTAGHLLLALGFTVYILVGVHFEEKDLSGDLGEAYLRYTRRTARFLPFR
ncbi:methanethiol S-methyltransferase [Solimonas soli]|uniref:methanethiol S-methyltransferase n=1 Tax=Solimonas soli TaxID=413479 RepID=UPI0004872F33|nr:methanethiol S-methyltransferase [Solimonas soli]